MGVTTDPNDPRLGHGSDPPDSEHKKQHETYLVLSKEEREKGFVRPLRRSYLHQVCGMVTTMSNSIAETYARQPSFYGATYCYFCGQHRPVGQNGEFVWYDSPHDKVGT